jgi:hypothetical protein
VTELNARYTLEKILNADATVRRDPVPFHTPSRASPRSFLTHHVANISTAIQTADAQTILNAASARMLRASFGVM